MGVGGGGGLRGAVVDTNVRVSHPTSDRLADTEIASPCVERAKSHKTVKQ